MPLRSNVVPQEANHVLILFKYIYKLLFYTRVFETEEALAQNIVCFWLIDNFLSARWLCFLSEKRKRNDVKTQCNYYQITS